MHDPMAAEAERCGFGGQHLSRASEVLSFRFEFFEYNIIYSFILVSNQY